MIGLVATRWPGRTVASKVLRGAVGSDVGIDCGAFSSGVKVSAQAARSTG